MELIAGNIAGLYTVSLKKLEDERGFFARTYCKNEFAKIGFNKEFVQFNHSFNKSKGTIRGMHFQVPPFAETKLIRCVQGAVYDVAVDLREGSPTFLQYAGIELNEENMLAVLIPEGFAHGFQVLKDNSALIYHHTEVYTPGADGGIRFDDPALAIQWPLDPLLVSQKDREYKLIDQNFKGIKV
ncbi:dTDP-4-dehydrorhamnose 3,5-epimerase [Ferruginibacter sp. HRS2-29]|uniref:dTDP-4-dehydrorhamnose 3,5-epimerase n=1 Tax=Ferruginibacter sp. HRS2-29 TaxID=2487334 RepID=UPI0020CCD201|nr:dTDP-4-dehydrorhamnose 3,5-epimerase [Ferruginibacter sp. HRS2-29]MCP9749908.1 dTDP-4-dehydrorhamnose 3,5-epimerase [Ferruginibacter sp. HRS2-29]